MANVTETILDKEPAVLFACFDELPKLVFDKKKQNQPIVNPTNPRRLLLQQFLAVADKKHHGSRSNAMEHSKKFFEASEKALQESIFKVPTSGGRDVRLTKATNLYRISVSSKRFSHKGSLTGTSFSLKSIIPHHLKHKASSSNRLV